MTLHTQPVGMNSDHLVEQFIYCCSHDLRSPLKSIKGLVKIAEYYSQSAEVYNCFRMIENSAEMMDKLIHALEEFMLVNKHGIKSEPINLDTLINNIIDEYRKEIDSKSIAIQKKTKIAHTINTDHLIFSLIFKHIFNNAISFQDSRKLNKYIDIQLDSTGDLLKLTLKDNGIGIPAAYHQKIFKPFFRASSQSKGQGMGLFLLNNLLNKINATINLQSKEHSGTTIIILIPGIK